MKLMSKKITNIESNRRYRCHQVGLRRKKQQLRDSIGYFFVHNKIPFKVTESTFFRMMFKTAIKVGENIPPPTACELLEIYLPK